MGIETQSNSSYKKVDGFTLVEATLVLIIVGFIITTIIFTTQARLDATRIFVTKERMEIILDALDRYVENYGHIPCPAAPNVTRQNSNYGWGTGTNGDEDPDNANCPQAITIVDDGSAADNDIVLGAVPFRTLVPPLDPQTTVDGWGNRFSYIVTERYTVTEGFQQPADVDGDYTICNHESCSVAGTNIVEGDQVAFILISHGPNGHYGYSDKSGNRKTTGTDASLDDLENGDSDNVFTQLMPRKRTEGSELKSTDDILIFKEKWQMPEFIND